MLTLRIDGSVCVHETINNPSPDERHRWDHGTRRSRGGMIVYSNLKVHYSTALYCTVILEVLEKRF